MIEPLDSDRDYFGVLYSRASVRAGLREARRYGNTSGWYYDGRDDNRDFPTNGSFPGNFATNPANAWIGAAGIFGSTPWRSATSYPSQVVIEKAWGQPPIAPSAIAPMSGRPAHSLARAVHAIDVDFPGLALC